MINYCKVYQEESLQMSEAYCLRRAHKEERARKRRALEPKSCWCRITGRRVTVNIEYPDYVSAYNKGPQGDIYCENLIECYYKHIQCRYSGISRTFPDPFSDSESAEEEKRSL